MLINATLLCIAVQVRRNDRLVRGGFYFVGFQTTDTWVIVVSKVFMSIGDSLLRLRRAFLERGNRRPPYLERGSL